MTMTASMPRPAMGGPWTIDDLADLPDNGYRYEITNGSLLVNPPPDLAHVDDNDRLCDLLKAQAPGAVRVLAVGAGIDFRDLPGDPTYYVPDILVIPASAIVPGGKAFRPKDVLLAVEVVSPGRPSRDLVLKRHDYGQAGIPRYWIVDPRSRTLTVLVNRGDGNYVEEAVARPGETYRTDEPFPLAVDPAEFT